MWLDFIVDKVLFWLLISLLVLEFYNLVFHKGIPNIRTAPAIREKIIALIKQDYEQRGSPSSYTIVDLGSGNGLFTREIAKELPRAKVVGLEIAKLSVLWSEKLKAYFGLKNLSYLRQDFLTYDFTESDVIVAYLLPWHMKKLSEKFEKETRAGTLIIANKFPLYDSWKTCEKTETVKTLYFHQGTLHTYRKA